MRVVESLLYQKSRSRWLSEGDANTRYFHACINSRRKSNHISAILSGDLWLESPIEIKKEVLCHFSAVYSKYVWERPALDGVPFNQLPSAELNRISLPFTMEEVEEAVFSCEGNKSPGPDGFNFNFIRSFWDILKEEVWEMVQQFFCSAKLPKGFNSSFISLIPKILNPFKVSDFRPISLIGYLYKIISKLLAIRLSSVLNLIISPYQTTFISNRQMLDGVAIINEVVDAAKKSRNEVLILKVDFEKAYDSVNWKFLEYMLSRFGFNDKWLCWIKACIFSGSVSVLVNGSPSDEIQMQKGLRQGDPLAPFLFLMIAEGLSGLMENAVNAHFFTGFKFKDDGPVLSHLQYADDTLLIGNACAENLWALKSILRCFELISGQKINFHKSSLIGLNTGVEFLSSASYFLNCGIANLPFKYLGLPTGANPSKFSTWQPVIQILPSQLLAWRGKFLSLGGRVVLINSVLSNIPIYYMSFFKMPSKVLKIFIRIQRTFLWGGCSEQNRIPWVRWETVCLPKNEGGLGVKNLHWFNLSLLGKWRWRLLNDKSAFWNKMISSRYGISGSEMVESQLVWNSKNSSSWWRDLFKIDSGDNVLCGWFKNGSKKRLGCGSSVRFWDDVWLGGLLLKNQFPRLFLLSNEQNAFISQLGDWCGGRWEWRLNWRRSLFVWEENQAGELLNLVRPISPQAGLEDKWVWLLDGTGLYTAKSAYLCLKNLASQSSVFSPFLSPEVAKTFWKNWAPKKVLTFSWLVLLDRVPSKVNLLKRNVITAQDSSCVFCSNFQETTWHLFFSCSVAQQVWLFFYSWTGVQAEFTQYTQDHYFQHQSLVRGRKEKISWQALWHTVIWSIWLARNGAVFRNVEPDTLAIMDAIKYRSWSWFSANSSNLGYCFSDWCLDPLQCIKQICKTGATA